MKKTIVIGCDHAGFKMKNFLIDKLKEAGYTVEDKGTYSEESVDADNNRIFHLYNLL